MGKASDWSKFCTDEDIVINGCLYVVPVVIKERKKIIRDIDCYCSQTHLCPLHAGRELGTLPGWVNIMLMIYFERIDTQQPLDGIAHIRGERQLFSDLTYRYRAEKGHIYQLRDAIKKAIVNRKPTAAYCRPKHYSLSR